jgi:hypothetical protein
LCDDGVAVSPQLAALHTRKSSDSQDFPRFVRYDLFIPLKGLS